MWSILSVLDSLPTRILRDRIFEEIDEVVAQDRIIACYPFQPVVAVSCGFVLLIETARTA